MQVGVVRRILGTLLVGRRQLSVGMVGVQHRRIRFHLHTLVETVVDDAGDHPHVLGVPGLLLQDGGDDEGIIGTALDGLGLTHEVHGVHLFDELVRLHLQNLQRRRVGTHLVGVGEEETLRTVLGPHRQAKLLGLLVRDLETVDGHGGALGHDGELFLGCQSLGKGDASALDVVRVAQDGDSLRRAHVGLELVLAGLDRDVRLRLANGLVVGLRRLDDVVVEQDRSDLAHRRARGHTHQDVLLTVSEVVVGRLVRDVGVISLDTDEDAPTNENRQGQDDRHSTAKLVPELRLGVILFVERSAHESVPPVVVADRADRTCSNTCSSMATAAT